MPLVRKPAAAANSPRAVPAALGRALASADPDERWSAARAAEQMPGVAAALTTALQSETESHVREALFSALARVRDADSIAALLGFLRSDNSVLRTGALDVLRLHSDTGHTVLPQLLKDPDTDVRLLSCELARGLPADEATSLLCALLADEPSVNVCAAAIDVLAEVGTASARPVLERCAARFRAHAFLGFAIKVAVDRITSQSARARD